MMGTRIYRGARLSLFRRSFHVCVVGSGPAGFYTAEKILKKFQQAKVDILERLPTPFGLVRSGVAPDHPETKLVINQFSRVAASDRCSFFGNVCVGKDLLIHELRELYNVVVLAYGAEGDRPVGIPGEHLQGVHSAREFVWWYNGHPEAVNLPVDLQHSESAVIIGQGNVALDVARILLRPVEELASTDITQYCLNALQASRVRKVYLVGRRGPVQAACTAKELREILGIRDLHVKVHEEDLITTSSDQEVLSSSRVHKRVYELFCKASQSKPLPGTGHQRELEFVFFRQPVMFMPSSDGQRVAGVQFEKTILEGKEGKQRALGTGVFEDLECGLALKSIGYKSRSMIGLPFDDKRGIIPNFQGRVLSKAEENTNETVEPGLYVVGWLKRGPTGIIGTNLVCADEVVESIAQDMEKGNIPPQSPSIGNVGLKALLQKKGIVYISFDDWLEINNVEISRGKAKGKPREKLTEVEEMLKVTQNQRYATPCNSSR